jgi:hypothetical protein
MHWIEGCWLQRLKDKGHGAGDTGLAMDFSSAEIIRWKFSVVQEIRQQKIGAQVLRHQLWIEVCSKDDLFCADGSQ